MCGFCYDIGVAALKGLQLPHERSPFEPTQRLWRCPRNAHTKWHSVITERPCAGTARMFDSDPNATASSDPLRGEPLC